MIRSKENPISKYDEDFDYMDEYDNFNIQVGDNYRKIYK